jgi:hypothetical protein
MVECEIPRPVLLLHVYNNANRHWAIRRYFDIRPYKGQRVKLRSAPSANPLHYLPDPSIGDVAGQARRTCRLYHLDTSGTSHHYSEMFYQ